MEIQTDFNEKEAHITTLTAEREAKYHTWETHTQSPSLMNIDEDALAYIFLPPKLLQKADNPDQPTLYISATESPDEHTEFMQLFAYETISNPLSSLSSLQEYNKAYHARSLKDPLPSIPPTLDTMHATFFHNMKDLYPEEVFGLHDKLYYELILEKNQDTLHTTLYTDNELLRGTGATHQLFKNLRILAKTLDVRFITSSNNENNIWFFRDTLHRNTLDQLKPEYQKLFREGESDPHLFTIEFLNEADKQEMVQ